MGLYINPDNGQSKEQWLITNAVMSLSHSQFVEMYETIQKSAPNLVLVCLVDNGPFTAAAVLFNDREILDLSANDGRRKMFFAVDKEVLANNGSGLTSRELEAVGL